MISFIHCADLHLDSPFKSKHHLPETILNKVMQSGYESFRKIVQHAIDKEVDFIIISGDVFDQLNRTLKAEVFIRDMFEQLQDHDIFVYMIHGNHDPLNDGVKTTLPENVVVFDKDVGSYELITKRNEHVFIHGFSYQKDMSYENKLDEYPTNHENKGIHIGILHGTYSKATDVKERYTEFTLEQLNEKLYHYWALGHIHKRQMLSDLPEIHYPGNIQGRHINESGEKGFLYVQGDKAKLKTRFIPTQSIVWDRITIETEAETTQQLFDEIKSYKDNHREHYSQMIYLELDHKTKDVDNIDLLEIRQLLNENELREKNFIWLEDLTWNHSTRMHDMLIQEFRSTFLERDDLVQEATQDLYLNPKANRYLKQLNDVDNEQLLLDGEAYLNSLMRRS